jgi:hypothetical protein
MRHFSDTHHLFFEAKNYQSGVAKTFRELPDNKVQLCRNEHNEIHATTSPPEVPSRAFMLQAIAQQLTKDLEVLDGEREVG